MKFKRLLNKFPPPEFLDVPVVAVVFSDSTMRVLALEKSTLKPNFYAELELKPLSIESGEIKNESDILESLSKVKTSINTPFVKFAVPDELAYVFTANLPVSTSGDMEESVAFILEENVPLPLSEISFDFSPVKIEPSSEGGVVQVVVTAISTAAVNRYTDLFKKVGLCPLLCVNESQATSRSVISREKTGHSILICVHRDTVGIYITKGRVVEFSSIISTSSADAESFVSLVMAELKKVHAYWVDKNPTDSKSTVLLDCLILGKHQEAKIILEEARKLPNIHPSLANVWTNAFSLDDYIPDISFEDSLRFASAVGLLVP